MTSRRALIAGVSLAVVLAVVVGVALYLIGPPGDERRRQLDRRRADDLANIAAAVDVYWTRNGQLPRDLAAMQAEQGGGIPASDPATGAPYEYRPVENAMFEVCATFEGESEQPAPAFWAHRAGHQCFRRQAERAR